MKIAIFRAQLCSSGQADVPDIKEEVKVNIKLSLYRPWRLFRVAKG
jgi:hypothetical protein